MLAIHSSLVYVGILCSALILGAYLRLDDQSEPRILALSFCTKNSIHLQKQNFEFNAQAGISKTSKFEHCKNYTANDKLSAWIECYLNVETSRHYDYLVLLDTCKAFASSNYLKKAVNILETSKLSHGIILFSNYSWNFFDLFLNATNAPNSSSMLIKTSIWDSKVLKLPVYARHKRNFWFSWAFTGISLLPDYFGLLKQSNNLSHSAHDLSVLSSDLFHNLSSQERAHLLYLKQSNLPLVSVITPMYNFCNLKWYCQHIQSILRQSLLDIEYVVVNDGSSLHCSVHNLLAQWLDDDLYLNSSKVNTVCQLNVTRFTKVKTRIIANKFNQGLSAARNLGAVSSKAPYIFFLDPDDMLSQTCIEKLVVIGLQIFQKPLNRFKFLQTGFVYSGVVNFKHDNESASISYADYDLAKLKSTNFLTSIALVDKKAFLQVGGNCENGLTYSYEDWDFWLRMGAMGYRGQLLREPLSYYRRHNSGNSHVIKAKGSQSLVLMELQKNNPSLYGLASEKSIHELGLTRMKQPGDNFQVLPCYRSLKPQYDSRPIIASELTFVSSAPHSIFYFIPWMTTGGADFYALHVLEALSSLKNVFITLIVERHLDIHPWQSLFRRVCSEMWFLQTMTNDTSHKEFILNHLVTSRRPKTVIVDRSSIGFNFVENAGANVQVASIVHMADSDPNNMGWEIRAGRAASSIDIQIVPSFRFAKELHAMKGFENFSIGQAAANKAIYVLAPPLKLDTMSSKNINVVRERTIVFCGRFAEQKNPLLWMDVVYNLISVREMQASFIMIGDGPLFNIVQQRAISLGINERINFLGQLQHGEVLHVFRTYAHKGTLLLTSQYEGTPLVVMESLASGLSILAPDIGSIREICTEPFNKSLNSQNETQKDYAVVSSGPCFIFKNTATISRSELVNKLAESVESIGESEAFNETVLKSYYEMYSYKKFHQSILNIFQIP